MNTSDINSRITELEQKKQYLQSQIDYYQNMLKACRNQDIEETIKKLSRIQAEAKRQLKELKKKG
jgi:hypothetical protein